jgi:uncharacterized metal-binding protein
MSEDCCASTVPTMILACAGGSNVGQLSNQAAVELTQEGFGKLFCLAGIGAHLSGFVQSARDIPQLVVIDGCEVGCSKGILEQAEVPVRGYLVLTELGIEKNKNLNLNREEVEKVKQTVRSLSGSSSGTTAAGQTDSGTCACR